MLKAAQTGPTGIAPGPLVQPQFSTVPQTAIHRGHALVKNAAACFWLLARSGLRDRWAMFDRLPGSLPARRKIKGVRSGVIIQGPTASTTETGDPAPGRKGKVTC